jgi:hypothetical protein
MEDKGYTITEPLQAKGTTAEGNYMYGGQMLSPKGLVMSYTVIACKDSADVKKQFDKSVSTMKDMGYSGSVDSDGDWTGTNYAKGMVSLVSPTYDVSPMYVLAAFGSY